MSLPDLLQTIDQLKAEIDALRPLPTETEQRILQKFRLDWNYHSNAMEGNSLTQGETETFLMEGLTAKGKPLKDHLDIKGHNTAINFLLEFVRHPESPLTEADLRELHRILLVEPYQVPAETAEGLPTRKTIAIGEYKTGPNNVRTPTGEIHFYATPEETPAKMGDLMRWYLEESQKGELHPVIIAAIFHHRFTAIHPFDDGNGRMSRLLMNLILMQRGYPPVVLQTQNRNEYLFALRAADQGKPEEFILLIGNSLIHSLELYLKGAKGIHLQDPGDVDKSLALLKLELKHTKIVERPRKRTSELQSKFFKDTLIPLIQSLSNQLTDLDEFFSTSLVKIEALLLENINSTYGLKSEVTKETVIQKLQSDYGGEINGQSVFLSFEFTFDWLGFNREGYDGFDVSSKLTIHLNQSEYILNIEDTNFSLEKMNQQTLSPAEIIALTSVIKSKCLGQIRAGTVAEPT